MYLFNIIGLKILKWMEAFEMLLYRMILRVPWKQTTSNVEILKRTKKDKEVSITRKNKKAPVPRSHYEERKEISPNADHSTSNVYCKESG